MIEDHNESDMSIPTLQKKQVYTEKQGQYLSFIYYYTKVNGIPPAQRDIQRFFRVSPPSVHSMIKQLEKEKLILRNPKTPRSLTVAIPQEEIPNLK
jgi:Mn-dependent DtxR family transcriptional regulator